MKESGSIGLVLVVVAALALPAPARAFDNAGEVFILMGVGGATVAVPAVIFTVADIVSWARSTPFATGWAVLETVVATLSIGIGAVWMGIAAHDLAAYGGNNDVSLALSFVPLGIGALNLTHAIWSFLELRSPEPDPARARVVPYVAPRGDGATAGVAGGF